VYDDCCSQVWCTCQVDRKQYCDGHVESEVVVGSKMDCEKDLRKGRTTAVPYALRVTQKNSR